MSPRIPGRLNDRRTPLGELNWIFTAITDTIAWNVLPRGEAAAHRAGGGLPGAGAWDSRESGGRGGFSTERKAVGAEGRGQVLEAAHVRRSRCGARRHLVSWTQRLSDPW